MSSCIILFFKWNLKGYIGVVKINVPAHTTNSYFYNFPHNVLHSLTKTFTAQSTVLCIAESTIGGKSLSLVAPQYIVDTSVRAMLKSIAGE